MKRRVVELETEEEDYRSFLRLEFEAVAIRQWKTHTHTHTHTQCERETYARCL